MEKGLFFNAFPNVEYETGYDRNYSADDISNWLQAVITNGVIKTDNIAGTGEPQGLKVLADNGLNIKVNVGMAVIKGKPYINNSFLNLTLATAPTSGTRYDCIILRMDNTQVVNARKTYLYVKSINNAPTLSVLTRDENVYELLLAYVVVNANVTTIQQSYIKDKRGDENYCPWCTAVKGYEDYYDAIVQRFESDITLSSAGKVVVTDLAVSLYNQKYSLISVYCNGLREDEEDYSVDTSNEYITIRFVANKSAGAQINVILDNFIDGEGLENVMDQYNELVAQVANLNKINEFNYYCNGSTDNVEISNIVNEFIASTGAYYKTLKLNIIGSFGMTAPYSGDGTSSSPHKIFAFDNNGGNRRFILDFTHCDNTTLTIADNSYTTIFGGANVFIKGGAFVAGNTTAKIVGFDNNARVRCEDSRFWIYGASDSMVASRGEFYNCKAEVRNEAGVSYCFFPTQGSALLIIKGGEYLAYTADSGSRSAIVGLIYNSAVVMSGVNAPTSGRANYYQTHAIYQTLGRLSCFGLVSALTVTTISGSNVYGTIALSLYNHIW